MQALVQVSRKQIMQGKRVQVDLHTKAFLNLDW